MSDSPRKACSSAVQKESGKGVDRRVHVAEVPLVGRHLTVGCR